MEQKKKQKKTCNITVQYTDQKDLKKTNTKTKK